MIDVVLLVLQNLTDSENIQGLCGEMSPAASQDAYQATILKTEVLTDAEAEEDPLAITFAEITVEPEVSCVFVSKLGRFQKYSYPSF
jgi:hypothetical protein